MNLRETLHPETEESVTQTEREDFRWNKSQAEKKKCHINRMNRCPDTGESSIEKRPTGKHSG